MQKETLPLRGFHSDVRGFGSQAFFEHMKDAVDNNSVGINPLAADGGETHNRNGHMFLDAEAIYI